MKIQNHSLNWKLQFQPSLTHQKYYCYAFYLVVFSPLHNVWANFIAMSGVIEIRDSIVSKSPL